MVTFIGQKVLGMMHKMRIRMDMKVHGRVYVQP